MGHGVLRLVPVLAALGLAGCATPPGGGTVEFTAAEPAASVGRGVRINVDASPLSGDRMDVFLQQDGSRKIAEKVLEKLRASSLGEQALPEALNVVVTVFRLRSDSSGLWLGVMAGVDMLDVSVEVVRGGKVVKTFSTDTSTAVAGILRPGAVSRFDHMVNTLAERIVAGI